MEAAEQAIVNDFVREYVDSSTRPRWGHKAYEKKNGIVHDGAVHRVCFELHRRKIPFATEVRLKCGNVADVVCPTFVYKIIEVLSTESEQAFKKKMDRFPAELRNEVLRLDAGFVYGLKDLELLKGAWL